MRCTLFIPTALAALALAGCSGDDGDKRPEDRSDARVTIGFLYVGETDDRGYNQAAFEGSRAIARAFPNARLIQVENVPETPAAEAVMERMIDRGATIVFPTSFGHLKPALKVAARHPDVTFLHQGGLQTADNLGTYFGTIWETQYLTGQAAGLATKTGRLGFVAAFPIAQSLLTINAFHLGARSVNEDVETRVVFTSSWCDPARQRAAAKRLLAAGADVLTQHQDCTRAVIETAAENGARTTGYHYDARDIAPRAWLTGSAWNWGSLYVDMVRTILAGRFAGSPYAGRFRVGVRDGAVKLASFGDAATPRIRARVRRSLARLRSGALRPFDGPIRDQRGRLRVEGRQPPLTVLEETDYLVAGVVGRLGP